MADGSPLVPKRAVAGTRGYAQRAAELIPAWEGLSFEAHHRDELPWMPNPPAHVLDVGAGIGVDAAWFAARGHRIVAVEPTAEFRRHGARRFAALPIEWLDDALPGLARVAARQTQYDLIMVSGVWQHLDRRERQRAMATLTRLLAPDGLLMLSLRHGPAPPERRCFAVSRSETLALAASRGLRALLDVEVASVQAGNRAAGVTWTKLVLRRDGT